MSLARESGIVFLGPWGDDQLELVRERYGAVSVATLGDPLTRVLLAGEKALFDDTGLLLRLSTFTPEAAVIGFFCDAEQGAEGVRVFQAGRETDRREVEWARAEPQDPVAWPLGGLALTFGLAVEVFTSVARPARPPLAAAIEALLRGEVVSQAAVLHPALELLGQLELAEATAALVRHLGHEDWVARYHAARGYARMNRGPGQDGRPRLEGLLEDEDEGVREAALTGLLELIPEVDFGAKDLIAQIDAAVARGLKDEDEDVREVAEQAAELRARLLG
ncbi:MAG: HEAT repeat domain-containing protein [Planctomycetota bacterium]